MNTKNEILESVAASQMGIFQILNKVNKKIYVGCSDDLDAAWNLHKSRLDGGVHPNGDLQSDYHKMGPDNFVFETLETLDVSTDDVNARLEKLEKEVLNRLQPFDDKGYNKPEVAV